MADFMTSNQRSRAMSAVRASETKIEIKLRSELHKRGFRFRKNVKDLPGRPDIVLPKHRCAIFVHGCFWHHHSHCKRSKLPTTRRVFWTNKIKENVKRDRRQMRRLRVAGWRVIVVWECQLNHATAGETVVQQITSRIMRPRV
jgi:DNA mismatch endonuclease, patch repair protein